MGKGEIARYEQFLLFPQCFQKACFPRASKGVIVWEWVKASIYIFIVGDNDKPELVYGRTKVIMEMRMGQGHCPAASVHV